MTDWTPPTGFFGWAADLGLWTGPTANLPPPPVLPVGADELDYFLGIPSPDGLIEHFQDGSYPGGGPGDYYDSGRYRSGGVEHTFDGGAVTIPGVHLIVSWYSTTEPDLPPEAVVPIGWTSGGTLDIGHWSDWQDPLIFDHPGAYQDGDGNPSDTDHYYVVASAASKGFIPGTEYPNLSAALADVPTQLAAASSPPSGNTLFVGSVSQGGNFSGGELADTAICDAFFQANVHVNEIGENHGVVGIKLYQWIATVVDPGYADPADQPSDPAPLAGLTLGIDYDYIPGTTDFAQYEDPAAARVGWHDWDLLNPLVPVIASITYNQASNGAAVEYFADYDPYVSFRKVDPADVSFEAIYASEVGGPGASGSYASDAAWPPSGIGTELSRLTVPAVTSGPASAATPIDPIPLDDVTDDSFTVVMQPSVMLGVVPPTHHPTSPDSTHDRSWASDAGVGYVGGGTITIPPPAVRYSSGRWRYWIPAPKWHTVGGHWGNLGAAAIRILTPLPGGAQWIDIVDGPG